MSAEAITNFLDLEQSEEDPNELVTDEFLQNQLRELHDRLFSYYPASNSPFSVLWRFNNGIERNLHEEYLTDFSNIFLDIAKETIRCRVEMIHNYHDPLIRDVSL